MIAVPLSRRVGYLAAAGFVLALLAHVSTFTGTAVDAGFPLVLVFQFGMILVWAVLMIFMLAKFARRVQFDDLIRCLPPWAGVACILVFAYTMIDLIVCMSQMEGNAYVVAGQYVLSSHGHVLAHLTEHEYHAHRALELRALSGVWLAVYAIPAVCLLSWREPPPARVNQ